MALLNRVKNLTGNEGYWSGSKVDDYYCTPFVRDPEPGFIRGLFSSCEISALFGNYGEMTQPCGAE